MALDVRAKTAKFWDGTCDSVSKPLFPRQLPHAHASGSCVAIVACAQLCGQLQPCSHTRTLHVSARVTTCSFDGILPTSILDHVAAAFGVVFKHQMYFKPTNEYDLTRQMRKSGRIVSWSKRSCCEIQRSRSACRRSYDSAYKARRLHMLVAVPLRTCVPRRWKGTRRFVRTKALQLKGRT